MLGSRGSATHLRTLLLTTITQVASDAASDPLPGRREASECTWLRAEEAIRGRQNEIVEQIALRLSIELRMASLSWSVISTAMEQELRVAAEE